MRHQTMGCTANKKVFSLIRKIILSKLYLNFLFHPEMAINLLNVFMSLLVEEAEVEIYKYLVRFDGS